MKLEIFLVPFDSGHENLRLGRGPGGLLERGLLEVLQASGHDVTATWVGTDKGFRAEITTTFDLCRLVAKGVRTARTEGRFPMVISGNCNIAVGTVSGLSPADLGIVWCDAHGEYNTPETTCSGYLDGMGLAMACGLGWPAMLASLAGFRGISPNRILHIGGRSFDSLEYDRMRDSGIRLCGPGESTSVHSEAMASLQSQVNCIYLHFDLDALDPTEGRANELATPCGLPLSRAENILRFAREQLDVAAFGLAGYDPSFDDDGRVARAAIRLVTSLLGNGSIPGRGPH